MSIDLETCYECMVIFQGSLDPVCPVCKLKKEVEDLFGLVRSLHPLE